MMQLEVNGRRFGIASGETIVGSDPASGVVLAGSGIQPRHLRLDGLADGSVAVRTLPGAEATLNGVALGGDPTPVLHGDKLRAGDHELLVVDPARAGSTRVAPVVTLPAPESLPPVARPAGLGAGRVVSLTDGREYAVEDAPLVFGRDAGADVVIESDAASRRHAELRPTAGGYILADASSNGTRVNGVPIEGNRVLARGDVIAIGDAEFRFSVDPVRPPLGAAQQLNDTLFGVPAFTPPTPAPAAAEPLAALFVRSGELKGQRLMVRSPVANIGRADYNDVIIADASVSSAHAKLQRRDDVWTLSDLGSTNGTSVDGETVVGEVPLGPGATIKLGAVRMMFEPFDAQPSVEVPAARSATRQMPAEAADREQRPEPPRRPVRPPRATVAEEPKSSSWGLLVVTGIVVIAAVAIAYMLLS